MATIIEELLVTLNIDAEQFRQGSRQAQEDINRTRNTAHSAANDMAASGNTGSQFFSKMRNEAMMLMGLFTAGMGLQSFVKNTINSAAQTGILADRIGLSTDRIKAFEAATERAGGSGQAMNAQLVKIADNAARIRKGESALNVLGTDFARFGGDFTKMLDPESAITEYARIYQNVIEQGRAKGLSEAQSKGLAAQTMEGMGVSSDILPLLKQSNTEMQKQVSIQQQRVALSDKDAAAAIKAKQAWFDLTQQTEMFGQKVILSLTPAMEKLTKLMSEVKLPNAEQVSKTIDTWTKNFIAFYNDVKPIFVTVNEFWSGLVKKAKELTGGTVDLSDTLTALTSVFAGLVAIKVALWIGSIATGLLSIASAAGVAASSLAPLAAIAGAGAAGAYVGTKAYESMGQDAQDMVGKGVATVASWFGDKEAKQALETNENYQKTGGGIDKGLGYISSRYEGGIGTAHKDNIGWAYGKFQFNTGGGLPQFLKENPQYAQELLAAGQPGSEGFNKKWSEIAKRDPEGFEAAQMKTGKNKYFNPAMAKAKSLGFNTENRGIQEAMFSGAVQHGGWNTKVLPRIAEKYNLQSMSAAEQLKAIYAERRAYASQNLSGDVLKGVLGRYNQEEANTIALAKATGDKKLNRPEISISNPNSKQSPPPVIIPKGEKDALGRLKQPELPQSAFVSQGMQTANNTQSNNITINVKSTDPKQAAHEIKTSLNEHLTTPFISNMVSQ